MTDYSKMSDKEINLAVHEAIIGYKLHPYGRKTYWYEGKEQQETTELPDYCNSWADAGLIIVINRIRLDPPLRDFLPWKADRGVAFECTHDNPLRAAMVVFLKLKDYGC